MVMIGDIVAFKETGLYIVIRVTSMETSVLKETVVKGECLGYVGTRFDSLDSASEGTMYTTVLEECINIEELITRNEQQLKAVQNSLQQLKKIEELNSILKYSNSI